MQTKGETEMEAIQDLWENTPLTATQIALRFETTKGRIIGLASRHGWRSYNGPGRPGRNKGPRRNLDSWDSGQPRTLIDRLTAEHRRMDEQLGLDSSGDWNERGRWVPGKRKEPEL